MFQENWHGIAPNLPLLHACTNRLDTQLGMLHIACSSHVNVHVTVSACLERETILADALQAVVISGFATYHDLADTDGATRQKHCPLVCITWPKHVAASTP